MSELDALLRSGRTRLSLGQTDEVVALVHANPTRAAELFACLWSQQPGVAARAADAMEKLSRHQPLLFVPMQDELLGLLHDASEAKLRWSLATVVARLPLHPVQARRAASLFAAWAEDDAEPSSIVRTASLEALALLAARHAALLPAVEDTLRLASRSGTAAMRARSRHLLQRLQKAVVDV